MDVSCNKVLEKLFLFLLLALLFVSVGMQVACSRSGGGTQSTVALQLPKTLKSSGPSAQAVTLVAQHVVVNITASDITPAIQVLDSNHSSGKDCDPNNPAPTSISMSVNQGLSRLVQVLVAYCDPSSSGGGFTIYYGDVTQDFTSAAVNVALSIGQIGGTTGGQGGFIGRYLNAAGTGPTGKVNMMYQPPGKPAMIIQQQEIFGGWFNFFGLQSQPFNFVLQDGTPILMNATLDSSFPSPQTAVIHIPAAYKNQSYGSSTPNYQLQSPYEYVIGFFGSSPATKNMCVNVGTQPTNSGYYKDASGTPLPWTGTTAGSGAYVSGGNQSASCSNTGTAFQDFIALTPASITSNDSLLGFKGPFLLQAQTCQTCGGSGPAITGQFNPPAAVGGTATAVLNWTYLPGATQGIDGFEVFYLWRQNPASGASPSSSYNAVYRVNNGIDCTLLLLNGFSDYGPAPAATASKVQMTLNLPAYPGNATPDVFVCPFTNGSGSAAAGGTSRTYFNSAAEWTSYSAGPQPATIVALQTPPGLSSSFIVQNTCTPLQVVGLTSANSPASLPMGLQIPFTSTAGFHATSNCSDTLTSATPQIMNSFGNTIYFSTGATAGSPVSVNIPSATNSLTLGPALNLNVIAAPSPSSIFVSPQVSTATPMTPGGCYPVSYLTTYQKDAQNLVVAAFSSGSIILPSVSGLTFFIDSSCNTASSTALTTGSSPISASFSLYFKYTGSAPTSFDIRNTSGIAAAPSSVMVPISAPGAATSIQANLSSMIPALSCLPLPVTTVDSNNNPAPTTAATAVSLAASTNLQFYTASNCQSGLTTSLTFAASSYTPSTPIYVAAPAQGPATLAISAAGLNFQTANITVGPALANHLLVALPGQTCNTGSVTGTIQTILSGASANIQVCALRPDNTIDINFNAPASNVPVNSSLGLSASNFAGGIANLTMVPSPGYYPNTSIGFQANSSGTLISGQATGALTVIPAPAKLSIYSEANPVGFHVGTCMPMMLSIEDSSGYSAPWNSATPLSITLSSSPTNLNFYSDDGCTVAASNPSFTQGTSAMLWFFKPTGAGTPGIIASSSLTQNGPSAPTVVAGTPSTAVTYGMFRGNIHLKTGICQPYIFYSQASNGSTPVDSAPFTNSFSITPPFAAGLYLDSACSASATPNFTNQRAGIFYIKSMGGGSSTWGLSLTGVSGWGSSGAGVLDP